MAKKAPKKLETTPYKGVRDFYPVEMQLERYIFETMRRTAESFGYVEYSASILEPAELYKAKTGQEIVSEQTYTFKDRGDREVTLRPEMTPTVARMVASRKRELSFPLRWYSIPNLFRYEQPQRGRLREHFQFNADIFGIDNERADIEVISLSYQLLKNFGAKDDDFEIRINDRNLLNYFWDSMKITATKRVKISRIIDKKSKITQEAFEVAMEAEAGKKSKKIIEALSSGQTFIETVKDNPEITKRLFSVIDGLSKLGVNNVVFTPTLVRGLDYYTGTVFEIFDKNPENPRSLFGGGRYDNLLEIFEAEKVPAVGVGAGDVTIGDFLKTRNLLPKYVSPTSVLLAVLDNEFDFADLLAEKLRDRGVSVSVDYTEKSIGDRIKKANSDSIPYFAVVGKTEKENMVLKVKNLDSRKETEHPIKEPDLDKLAEQIRDKKI